MKPKFRLEAEVSTDNDDDSIYHNCSTADFSTLLEFIARTDLFSICKKPELYITVDSKDVKEFLHLWQDYLNREPKNGN